jgi:uncharacterized protein YceH (UPF0502 family)
MQSDDSVIESGPEPGLTPISAIEARVLGALIEKEATTPEAYPLTANAVVLACNQKNNREPVMELEAGEVGHTLREMGSKGLIGFVHGARAQRYEHRFAQAYSVTSRQQALLSLLLLRGPQTLAELHSRSERLVAAADVDEVRQTLERLMQRTPALVVKLERAHGQREDRYMHLLCGPVSSADYGNAEEVAVPSKRIALEARVDALEAAVESLRRQLDELRERGQ